MVKYIFLFLIFGLVISCKEQKPEGISAEKEPEAFSFQDFPKLIELHQDVLPVVANWPEYTAMENSILVLKRATNTEDVKFAIDDLIEKEKALAKAEYPKGFDKLQIKSRQQLFRTFLYKVKGNLMDNRDINEAMGQLVNAYNAYINQFNILGSNTLDPKLILDEE